MLRWAKTLPRRLVGNYRTDQIRTTLLRAARAARGTSPPRRSPYEHAVHARRDHHVFFGYYDISPFDPEERRLLAVQVPRTSAPGAPAIVGYYDGIGPDSSFIPVAETPTWCWQQSCRLQWYPGTSLAPSRILFNDLEDRSHYVCRIVDVDGSGPVSRATIPHPVYSVSPDGKIAATLNFSRLQRLRSGYGYSLVPDETANDPRPADDGVWLVDMQSGSRRLRFSLEELAAIEPHPSMDGAQHYVNHLMFGPSGARYLFFHLWDSFGKRRGRMFVAETSSEDPPKLVNNEGHTSHYAWRSDEAILAYASHRPHGPHYYLYDLNTGKREIIGKEVLGQDGHPSFMSQGNEIITDTYADRFGDQRLLRFQLGQGHVQEIGTLYTPPKKQRAERCDLHPRISPSGRFVCVDCDRDGSRSMIVFDLTRQRYD